MNRACFVSHMKSPAREFDEFNEFNCMNILFNGEEIFIATRKHNGFACMTYEYNISCRINNRFVFCLKKFMIIVIIHSHILINFVIIIRKA